MAWPCISRVCCLARFWNQFDKSDLSVPLTIQNYSDIADQEVRSVTKQVSASEARKDLTQYKQDFKPWPIPRKENFPWISNGGSSVSDSPVNSSHSGVHVFISLFSYHFLILGFKHVSLLQKLNAWIFL
uniref:MAP6 domain containing 1 n=1 Tax=Sphaeramia orbicularis TaxID=375764 RepID=A0A673ANB5_9TELE